MPLGAAQAQEGSSAKALPAPRPGGREGGAGRGLPRQHQGRAPRPSPRRLGRAFASGRRRDSPRPERRCRRAGAGLRRGLDRPGAAPRSERSCCRGPERRRFASFLPSFLPALLGLPAPPGLRRGRGGGAGARGAERGGRAGGGRRRRGGTHVLCTCRSISRISVNLSRRSMGSCSITAGTRGSGREGGGREPVSHSLPWGRGGCRLFAAASPGSPAPADPAARRPRRVHTHSPDSPPGTAWRRPGPRPGAARERALVPSNMAPPPTTPAPRLSENNIGGGRRSPRPRRDWLFAPLTHTAARALPRRLTGSVVRRASRWEPARPARRCRSGRSAVPGLSRYPGGIPAFLGAFPPHKGPRDSSPGAAFGPPERPWRDHSAANQANRKGKLAGS